MPIGGFPALDPGIRTTPFRLAWVALFSLRMQPTDEQRILVTQAEPGMVLAKHVTMPNRVVLCAAGMELNAAVINHLLARGIKRIHVKGHPLPAYGEDEFQVMMRKLRMRFSRVRHFPFMAGVEQAVENALVRHA